MLRNTTLPTRQGVAETPRLLTTPEAAAALGIGKRTLQERVKAREIDYIKMGKSVRFSQDDLAAFIEANRQKATGWKRGSK